MTGRENNQFHHGRQDAAGWHQHDSHAKHSGRSRQHSHTAGKSVKKKKAGKLILAAAGIILVIALLALAAARQRGENKHEENKQATEKEKSEQRAPPEKALSRFEQKITSAEYAAEYTLNQKGKESELKLYFTKTGAAAINGNNKRMLAKINGEETILECIKAESEKWACTQSIKEDMTKTILKRNLKDMKWKESIKVGGKDAECFEKRELLLCYDTDGKLVYARRQEKTREEITLKKELPPEEAEKETKISETEEKASEQPPLPTGIKDACSKCELLAESERERCYDEC